MGSRQSDERSRQDLGSSNAGSRARGRDESEMDYAELLAYLMRSGQIRLISSGPDLDFGDSDDDSLIECCPQADLNPDTRAIDVSDLKQEMLFRAGMNHSGALPKVTPVSIMLSKRAIGKCCGLGTFSRGDRSLVSESFLPNSMRTVAQYCTKAFCGNYSKDGSVFLSACQDQTLRIYDTTNGQFMKFKEIKARNVGWSILDTAFSPDGNYLIYSSWSEYIHLCNVRGDFQTHVALDMEPGDGHFCPFSVQFSSNNREILAGANDGFLYIFDREINKRTMRIDAHEDDINSVRFADESSQILFSGGDDGLCKVWDRRMLSDTQCDPVGMLAGHTDGITCVDSKGDGRHLITNSKDQSVKLWDLRVFSPASAVANCKRAVAGQHWDYRWQQVPRRSRRKNIIKGDTSLLTYRGHGVLHTCIRCHFSPMFTTDQKYIYCGCATGGVVIYDVLTGKIVRKLDGHRGCVRDVSWHPYENNIISSSWDGSHGFWEYKRDGLRDWQHDDFHEDSEDSSNDEDDIFHTLRKARRARHYQQPTAIS
ncbi:DDB1- and CUL4-associated factor 11-like [Acanthaster planci]|uniref:DDB1- and CUL4-associated factor 11-like n=1 Tax=Acanthaster planci TaxID=133434 RepID=A0A8B7YK45_ACAPL|nr:DDB1- and CUL4-associated factor 11-like [Acanthaster planci]